MDNKRQRVERSQLSYNSSLSETAHIGNITNADVPVTFHVLPFSYLHGGQLVTRDWVNAIDLGTLVFTKSVTPADRDPGFRALRTSLGNQVYMLSVTHLNFYLHHFMSEACRAKMPGSVFDLQKYHEALKLAVAEAALWSPRGFSLGNNNTLWARENIVRSMNIVVQVRGRGYCQNLWGNYIKSCDTAYIRRKLEYAKPSDSVSYLLAAGQVETIDGYSYPYQYPIFEAFYSVHNSPKMDEVLMRVYRDPQEKEDFEEEEAKVYKIGICDTNSFHYFKTDRVCKPENNTNMMEIGARSRVVFNVYT
jgi:hypothetical protein